MSGSGLVALLSLRMLVQEPAGSCWSLLRLLWSSHCPLNGCQRCHSLSWPESSSKLCPQQNMESHKHRSTSGTLPSIINMHMHTHTHTYTHTHTHTHTHTLTLTLPRLVHNRHRCVAEWDSSHSAVQKLAQWAFVCAAACPQPRPGGRGESD